MGKRFPDSKSRHAVAFPGSVRDATLKVVVFRIVGGLPPQGDKLLPRKLGKFDFVGIGGRFALNVMRNVGPDDNRLRIRVGGQSGEQANRAGGPAYSPPKFAVTRAALVRCSGVHVCSLFGCSCINPKEAKSVTARRRNKRPQG